MNITDTITALSEILDKWGDVPVKVGSIEGYELFDIEIIPVGSSKKDKPPAGRMVVIDRLVNKNAPT